MDSFTIFSKRIENCIDAAEAAEAAGALHTDTQITNKVFSVILKAHIFIIECKSRGENLLPTKHSLILNNVFE